MRIEFHVIFNPLHQSFPFIIAHDFGAANENANAITFDASGGLESFAQLSDPQKETSRSIFIRGYSSPEWICLVGSQYRIDIEYFRQRLHLLEDKEFYDSPPPPSNSPNILGWKIPTLFKRQTALSPSEVQRLCHIEKKASEKYQGSLHTVGESILRHLSIHVEITFTVEQDVLIYLVNKRGRDWTGRQVSFPTHCDVLRTCQAIAWFDAGRNLPQSDEPPWQGLRTKCQNPKNECLPTV